MASSPSVDPAAAQRALAIPEVLSVISTRDDQEAGKDESDFMDSGLTNEGFGIGGFIFLRFDDDLDNEYDSL